MNSEAIYQWFLGAGADFLCVFVSIGSFIILITVLFVSLNSYSVLKVLLVF